MRQERINKTITVLTLICIGIVMIYSASCVNAMQNFGDSLYYLNRHLLFLSLGLVASFFILSMDYRQIQPHARMLIAICTVLLLLVLVPHIGKESYGARRWFKLGVFHFQPSELAKLGMIIYTADFLSRKQQNIKSFIKGFLPFLMFILILVFCGGILLFDIFLLVRIKSFVVNNSSVLCNKFNFPSESSYKCSNITISVTVSLFQLR